MVLEPASVRASMSSHFQRFSSPKPLGRGNQCVYKKSRSHNQRMVAMAIYGKTSNIFSSGSGGHTFNETWHEATMAQVLQCVYKS